MVAMEESHGDGGFFVNLHKQICEASEGVPVMMVPTAAMACLYGRFLTFFR